MSGPDSIEILKHLDLHSLIIYSLFALSIVSMWIFDSKKPSIALLSIGLLFAAAVSVIKPLGLIVIILLALCSYYVNRSSRSVRGILKLSIFVLGTLLLYHYIPGFSNIRAINQEIIKPNSLPYTFYLNADTIPLGIIVAITFVTTAKTLKEVKEILNSIALYAPLTIVVLLVPSVISGYVAFEPFVPSITAFWLVVNLIFVCFVEEVFYRGFLLQELYQSVTDKPWGKLFSLGVSSFAFALQHYYWGGICYALLAYIAGVLYGLAYLRKNSIESSIFTHLALNTVHFFLFTYPAQARAL